MLAFNPERTIPRSISLLLVFVLVTNAVLFGVIFQPKPAEAQFTDVAALAQRAAKFVWDAAKWVYEKEVQLEEKMHRVWEKVYSHTGILAEVTAALAVTTLHIILAQMTNDITAWINGGGKGKIRVLQDPGKMLANAVDQAGGILMGAILNVDSRTLCDASYLKFTLAPTFAGPYAVPTFDEQVACTFSGMADGLRRFQEDFRNGGWRAFIDLTRRENNRIGQALIVQDKLAQIQAQQTEVVKAKIGISKGFLSQDVCTITRGRAGQEDFDKQFITRKVDDVINSGLFRGYDPEEFKEYWISQGGMVECKTVTPAEQVSELATTALTAPIKKLESAINGIYPQTSRSGLMNVLRPYVMAIANSGLNLLVKKEIGLIQSALTPPPKPRKTNMPPSDALQQNTMLAQSAGTLVSSANDFRSFILRSLLDFSLFVTTAAQVTDASDVLGTRTPLNRVEYTALKGSLPSGFPTGQLLNINVPVGGYPSSNPDLKDLAGWLSNTVCEFKDGTTSDAPYLCPARNPDGDLTTGTVQLAVPTPNGNVNADVAYFDAATGNMAWKMITTYPSGKIFYEEAKWCGAYAQETPIPTQAVQTPISPFVAYDSTGISYPCADGVCAGAPDPHLLAFKDDDDDFFDRYAKVSSATPRTTLVIPAGDTNRDGAHDTATTTASGIAELFAMEPNFTNDRRDVNGAVIGATGRLAQPAGAESYLFGGYNDTGFSNSIIRLPTNRVIATLLPTRMAGAEAVYYPPNGRIYIFGGFNENGLLNTVYEFNPSDESVRNVSAHFSHGAYGMTGAYHPDTQRIYLFGGKSAVGGVVTVSDAIYEFNQITDTITEKNARLERPIAHASAALAADGSGSKNIYIFGGMDGASQAVGDIVIYNPMVRDNAAALTRSNARIKARGYLAALPINANAIRVFGGENTFGRLATVENYSAANDAISPGSQLVSSSGANPEPLSQMGRAYQVNGAGVPSGQLLAGGIADSPTGTPGAKIFPQGDIFYIPVRADAIAAVTPIFQKFFSAQFDGGTVTLLNSREDIDYKDPTLTIVERHISSDTNQNSDEVAVVNPFYPELLEKIQELMEKLRILKGYNYANPGVKNYASGLGDQVGSIPDDDPNDNNPDNPLYDDRTDQNGNSIKGYKGSVSDVVGKYKNLTEAYQALYSGTTDENTLEGIDKDMTVLTPTETNIKQALIGERCPISRPSATSTPDIFTKCPVLASGEYNMARKFVFEPDDQSGSTTGITTGFATNPFTGQKSSALAGILNLEDMAQQLQSLPPDKNLVKLIRLRQLLEQLQVPVNTRGDAPPIQMPGKTETPEGKIYPKALTGVDIIQVSIPGHENIQNWLNDTVTRNKDIQELIEAYGYATAKEAYPEISKELDEAFDTITGQVLDKTRVVFLKRIEEELEDAKTDAQYRLGRFIEYARDLSSEVKLEVSGDTARRMLGFGLINPTTDQIGADSFVLRAEAFPQTSNPNDPHAVANLLVRGTSAMQLANDDRSGLIGSAVYKIKTLAKFAGIDTTTPKFAGVVSDYINGSGETPDEINADLDNRLTKAMQDAYLLYRGVSDQTDPDVSDTERAKTAAYCKVDSAGHYCNLNAGIKIYKDARMKLRELENDFALMMDDFSAIKDDFSELISNANQEKDSFERLLASFTAMEDDYDQANACVGMPISAGNWGFTATQKIKYEAMGIAAGALMGAAVGSFVPVVGTAIGAVLGAVVGFVGSIFGIGSSAKKKKKKAQAKVVNKCRDGIINYNRHLGQLADDFLCGRVNPRYQD